VHATAVTMSATLTQNTTTATAATITSKLALSQELGADWVVYSDLDSMVSSVMSLRGTGPSAAIDRLDCSCFDGKYVTGDIDEAYFEQLRQTRSDAALTAARCATPDVSCYCICYLLVAKACTVVTLLSLILLYADHFTLLHAGLSKPSCQCCAFLCSIHAQ
jgi:hypothetical protein